MHDFMKTIISAIKNWTIDKIDEKLENAKVVPDWDQNDPSQNGYIKNRPFYEENNTVVFIPETTLFINDGYLEIGTYEQLVSGNTYYITLNGVQYECVARQPSEENYVLIGNGAIYGDGNESNGEPFSCDSYPDGLIYLNVAESGEYTISISIGGTVVHKLDLKYLPDEIGVQADWFDNNPQSKAHILNKPSLWNDENGDVYIGIDFGNTETASQAMTEKSFYNPKYCVIIKDEVDGHNYVVSVKNGNLVSYCTTDYIYIDSMPNKITYVEDEAFNPSGMVIMAHCMDDTTRELRNYTYEEFVTNENANNFTISYTEGNNVFTSSMSLDLLDFSLIDFNYTYNNDGTYTLNSWRGTYNGEPSTRIVVPNSELIIVN